MAQKTANTEWSSVETISNIRLINAIDEALIMRELLSPKSLRTCQVTALIDPSSVYLVLPETVVRQLGLRLVGQKQVMVAGDRIETWAMTEALRIEWDGQIISEDALVGGDQVRLGRVVLEKLGLPVSAQQPDSAPVHLDPAPSDLPIWGEAELIR